MKPTTRRNPYENRYCGHCQMTTRHEIKQSMFGIKEYDCLRCGSVKYPKGLLAVLKPKVA